MSLHYLAKHIRLKIALIEAQHQQTMHARSYEQKKKCDHGRWANTKPAGPATNSLFIAPNSI